MKTVFYILLLLLFGCLLFSEDANKHNKNIDVLNILTFLLKHDEMNKYGDVDVVGITESRHFSHKTEFKALNEKISELKNKEGFSWVIVFKILSTSAHYCALVDGQKMELVMIVPIDSSGVNENLN